MSNHLKVTDVLPVLQLADVLATCRRIYIKNIVWYCVHTSASGFIFYNNTQYIYRGRYLLLEW